MTFRLRAVNLDDLLLLPLPERIKWLHGPNGPKGELSHDKLAVELGVPNRQTIIGWENGREPSARYAQRLSEFSGFPDWVFRRREAEEAVGETIAHRLHELAGTVALAGAQLLAMERSLSVLENRVRELEADRESREAAPKRRVGRR